MKEKLQFKIRIKNLKIRKLRRKERWVYLA